MELARGKVVRYDRERGWGFLSRDSGKRDVFVHWSAIQGHGYRRLAPGQRVEYEVITGPDGRLRAENVRTLDESELMLERAQRAGGAA